jgi:hypothetical protein
MNVAHWMDSHPVVQAVSVAGLFVASVSMMIAGWRRL